MSAFVLNPYAFGKADLKSSLLHYWDLSATATTMSDLKGSLNLTRGGTVNTNSTGAPDGGSCVEMNLSGGTTGQFSASNIAKLSAYDTGVTINIWARSTSSATFGNWLINHRNSSAANTAYFQLTTRGGGNDGGSFFNTSSGIAVAATQESLNTWQMLTLRKDGNAIELFRNGSSLGTATFTGSFGTANAPFAIGMSSWTLGNNDLGHRGRLFAAGIWGDALNQAQITALYNGGNGLRYADLP